MLDSERKHWVSVAAAIVDGDRVLAIRRRDNNKWEPPGGTLEPSETILGGLRREVFEETGVTINTPKLSGVYKNMTNVIVALVFRCGHAGAPTPTEEAAEVAWLTRNDIDRLMDEAYAVRLIDALESTEVTVRVHDGEQLLDELNT